MPINVLVNGAKGKMGQTVVNTIGQYPDLRLVATTNRQDNLAETIQQTKTDVVIDFTTPDDVFATAKTIIASHAHPVIGTTGLQQTQIKQLQDLCQEQKLGGIIAPNFSMGAVLMMKYAQDAIQYLPDAEIIELHHPQKVDAPSGTAIKTALLMKENQQTDQQKDIPIHSVRLPGLVAHQMVILGGHQETLTIRHDSIDRAAFMPGVFMACRKVMTLNHLVYGLENILV